MPTPNLIEKYGAKWPADSDPLMIEFACIQRGGSWVGKLGQACGAGLFEHYMAARKLIWPHRYRHRWTDLMFKEFLQNEFTVLMGAASCVSGDTKLLDPLTGKQTPIKELCEKKIRPMVMTLDGPEMADVPYVKGVADLYEVKLANGSKFTATGKHRALSPDGFVSVDSLRVGKQLLVYDESRQSSNLDNGPSVPWQDARSFWKIAPDSQSDYLMDSCSDDEPLHRVPSIFRDAFPSPSDAHRHLCRISMHEDDRGKQPARIPFDQLSFLHSSFHDLDRNALLENYGLFRVPSETDEHACQKFLQPSPFQRVMLLGHSSRKSSACCESKHCSHEVLYDQISPVCEKERFAPSSAQSQTASPSFSSFCILNKSYRFRHRTYCAQSVSRFPLHLSIASSQIVSIRNTKKDVFYDLEVPKAHHYFAEGTIHHNTQKTSHASEYALLKYWAFPNDTIVLVTTMTMEKLDHAIFAEIKMLFKEGLDRYPWLDGHVIDHRRCIATDDLEEEGTVRDLRCGIVGRPCYVGKQYVGAGIFAGIKNRHVIFIADELQFCEPTFLAAADNLFSNDDVSIIASGNPQHNPDDQLGIAAEPIEGWNSLPEPTKTTTWQTRLYSGRCVNLVGTDSPNFDQPTDIYKGLIGRKFVKRIKEAHDEGEHSRQFYSQVKGVMRIDLAKDRVITRDICYRHHAMDQPIWSGKERTKIYAIDPAYGGGDRCTAIWYEFGEGHDGKQILYIAGHREIPINLQRAMSAEDQIAEGVAEDLVRLGIPTQNAFYDSFGKGTVGFAFARKFGSNSPIPIDSGGRTTSRPVRQDLLVWDDAKRQKRPKRCDEHYSKFVTEMWFSVRYAIEAEQLRGLPEQIMLEGCMREYRMVAGDKIEVEKKEDLRERLGRSPDWFDVASLGCEGARQRGFMIERLGTDKDVEEESDDYLAEEARNYQDVIKSKLLVRT